MNLRHNKKGGESVETSFIEAGQAVIAVIVILMLITLAATLYGIFSKSEKQGTRESFLQLTTKIGQLKEGQADSQLYYLQDNYNLYGFGEDQYQVEYEGGRVERPKECMGTCLCLCNEWGCKGEIADCKSVNNANAFVADKINSNFGKPYDNMNTPDGKTGYQLAFFGKFGGVIGIGSSYWGTKIIHFKLDNEIVYISTTPYKSDVKEGTKAPDTPPTQGATKDAFPETPLCSETVKSACRISKDSCTIGESKGTYKITKYYTPERADFESWENFANAVKMQGSGTDSDKKCLYRYYSVDEGEEKACIATTDTNSRGITAMGTNPTAGRTIAVNENFIARGSTVYIDFGEDNSKSGIYAAEDTGSAFSLDYRGIDIYAGAGMAELNSILLPQYAAVYAAECK